MRLIKNIVLAIHIIAVLVVTYFTLTSNHLVLSEGFTKCEQYSNDIFITEDSSSFSVLYKGNYLGVVSNIYKSNQSESGVTIENFSVADEIYVLEKTKTGYRIKALSRKDLTIISLSDSFALDNIDSITDFYANLSNGQVYITALNSSKMGAFVYKIDLNSLIPVGEYASTSQEGQNPNALYPTFTYESQTGTIDAAYYDDISKIIVADSLRPLENAIDPYKYARSLDLSLTQSININILVLLIFIAYAIIGVIIILIVSNLIERRRRFIDLILLNEIFILAVMASILLLFGSLKIAIIWTILVSLVNIGVILYENRDIMVLCTDMKRISTGVFSLDKPGGTAKETQTLWRGMNEVKFLYEEYKYIQDTTTAAALRFLPHSIGSMFNSTSLDEIKPGDNVFIPGTFMIFNTKKELSGELVGHVEEYEKNAEGTLLTGECSLSSLKMIFPNSLNTTISEGLNFYGSIVDQSASTLYFNDAFNISVVGTQTKSILNVSSTYMNKMQEFSDWFFRLGISMVITEDVKDLNSVNSPLRKIGYCYINGKKNTFYEVLNAYNEHIRANRLKCLQDFDNALGLFYKNDYYLARTAFSDILKIDPQDELARWYLFICEKYLNDPDIVNKSSELDPRN